MKSKPDAESIVPGHLANRVFPVAPGASTPDARPRLRVILLGLHLATASSWSAPHLTDNFDTGSYGAASFNDSIVSDQGGTLAGTGYSVIAPTADWQAQHSNGGSMILVGDAGYCARASLNQNFATLANTADAPVSFQMDAWVSDTANANCWASITIGSGQNLLANDTGSKFAILPEVGGGLQVILNGSQQIVTARNSNNFRIVLSDTVGKGSAFNGKGSRAALYNGANLVGTYTLAQLTAGDGYLSFSACPYNGSWNITHIDNLSIRVEDPATPMKWTLWTGNATWPADKRASIIAAMEEAVGLYNSNGYFPKSLVANYNAGVPTAQAGYGGWMDFGNSFGTRVTLHEIAHTLGCGTHWNWPYKQSGGQWTGEETLRFARLFDGPSATISCDTIHFWPYGLNYDHEDSPTTRLRHVKIVAAMRRDMGIVGISEDDGVYDDDQDGLPDDWEMFRFGNLEQTATGNPDQDEYNNLQEYQIDTNPNSSNQYTWAGGDGNWNSVNWSPGPSTGPTSAYESATINSGSVHVNVAGIGNVGAITVAGGTLNAYNWNGVNTYTAFNNLILRGGGFNGNGNYNNWGAGILSHVTANGSAASTISAGSFFNLRGTGADSSVIDVADASGNPDADLSVSAVLADVSADWSWSPAALVKSGEGTLKLSAGNSYSGGTSVNAGTLMLDGASGGNARIRGALIVNPTATVAFSNDDGTGLGWNDGAKVTSLAINGGTVTSPGIIHVWNLGTNLTLTGGTLQSNNGTSDATGPQLEWGGTTLTTQASESSSVVAGRVRFRTDFGTVHTINVADGAAATDLLISAALTETSRCNLLKTGPGTLRITGSVQLTGVINVEAGTLDFAPSSVSPSLRISVAEGAHVNLSNAAATSVKNVYVAGRRLSSGTWGAPGSGAANESPVFTGSGILEITDTGISNRERWKRMKYGQFTHYVWDGSGVVTRMPDGSNSPSIDYLANNFDAVKFANDVESMGVEYVIFTAWHANFNPLFNSSTFDRYGYWYRRSQRDMLGDMISAVKSKGIRVLFYTHPNQPIDFNWWTHNNMINDIYAEMVDRYGDQIDGFYLDENDPGGNQDNMVDFARLERTIRLRNPDLMLIQNFYGNLYSCDVPMGESGPASAWFSKDIAGASTTSYAQVMSNSWSAQVPVSQYAATRSPEGIFRAAVMAAGSCTDGGGTAWAAGPFPGGQWEQGVLEAMQGAGQLMAPVAESIKGTYPSTSWPTPSGTWIGNLPNGMVATRSPDDTREYIHVLNPPSGNTLTLPAPADGKVFANARLLTNNQPVTLARNARAVTLTLTGTSTWDVNDTVIVMDVVSSGDPYLANNTTPDAIYTGSWIYDGNRATNEFGRDVHVSTVNGDFVEYAFDGTDIELIVSCGPNRGTMDIYVDGVFQQTVDATSSTDGLRKTMYHGSGFARGNHTLRVVKTGGTFLAIDGFRATEMIDSTQPDVGYQALTFFNNTETTPNPVGYIEYSDGWSWQQRDRNEYNYDAHWAQWNGAYFNIHFNGTGVQFIGTYDGIIDFYIDDVFVKQVNMRNIGGMARVLGLDLRGLPPGNHTLRGVKVGDTYCLVDAFFVYNSQNANWSAQTDGASIGGSYQRSSAYGDAATLAFRGTGVEIIAPHQISGGTVAVSIQGSGYQDVAAQFVNQYAGDYRPQSLSFASHNVLNLADGNYLLRMAHNRSFGSIALDAFRVYKNRPGSGPALRWGASGGGGSGTWDVNGTANWWDGANATAWYDFGASDYAAQFAGAAGTVNLAANANVNRLSFDTTGFVIQGNAINLNGNQPRVHVLSGATASVGSLLKGSNGLIKDGQGVLKLTAASSYGGGTMVNAGTLELNGASGGTGRIQGAVTVKAGATLAITGGDGSGFGWSNTVTNLTVAGGTANASGGSHIGFGAATSVALNGGGVIAGNWQWNGDNMMVFASSGDSTNTISGALVLRSDGGNNHTFNVADGSAAVDLQVDANLSDQWPEVTWVPASSLVKAGSGTMVLSGTNTYDGATVVNQGVLSVGGSILSTSSITIASGGELRASGTLHCSGNVTNSGTLVFTGAAGFSVGGTITNHGTIINSSPSLVLPVNIVNYGTIINLPAAPGGLVATPGATSVTLTWNAVSGASSYVVKQATSSGGPYTAIGSPATTSFTAGGLTTGSTYHFVVSAVNTAGQGADSSAVSVTPGSLPPPWVTANIGTVGVTGDATAADGIFTINGSGTGVYARTDQFRMVYQNSSGDCQIIARVESLTAPSVSAKAGVMIRESLAANARCAGLYVTPSAGVQFIWRSTTGGMVSIATVSGLTAPRWVRLQRVGNSFRAYHSTNGTSWTQFGGNKTISMATNAYLGQAVTSGTNASLCTAVISNVTATP